MVNLKDSRLQLTLLGSLGVLSGLIIRNSAEQLKITGDFKTVDSFLSVYVAPVVFVVGWAIIGYSVALPRSTKGLIGKFPLDRKTIQAFASVIGIVVSIYQMRQSISTGVQTNMIYPSMYVAGWLLLGHTVGSRYGYLSSLLALLATILVLPFQRSNCIVDGPGMPMLTIAFVMLAYANSQ